MENSIQDLLQDESMEKYDDVRHFYPLYIDGNNCTFALYSGRLITLDITNLTIEKLFILAPYDFYRQAAKSDVFDTQEYYKAVSNIISMALEAPIYSTIKDLLAHYKKTMAFLLGSDCLENVDPEALDFIRDAVDDSLKRLGGTV